MEIRFSKMHGTLNDFVVFSDLNDDVDLTSENVKFLCDRRAGVGADGVIVVRGSDVADFFMDYVNADGSFAEMCGNGIRCLAKYVYDKGLTGKKSIPVETRAGIKTVELITGPNGSVDSVRVDMGRPIFDSGAIPVNIETNGDPIVDYPVSVGDRIFRATILSMGNPHCVIMADGPIGDLHTRFGPAIERDRLFPAKTNVEFVETVDRERMKMRVWERGSGETMACGTGACAVAVAAQLKGLADSKMVIELAGGELELEWKGSNNPVIMTGPTRLVFEGKITI